MRKPTAIDPLGCGCTECITGEYVPLDRATPEQVLDMLTGGIRNNLTGWENDHLEATVTVSVGTFSWLYDVKHVAELGGLALEYPRAGQ